MTILCKDQYLALHGRLDSLGFTCTAGKDWSVGRPRLFNALYLIDKTQRENCIQTAERDAMPGIGDILNVVCS